MMMMMTMMMTRRTSTRTTTTQPTVQQEGEVGYDHHNNRPQPAYEPMHPIHTCPTVNHNKQPQQTMTTTTNNCSKH